MRTALLIITLLLAGCASGQVGGVGSKPADAPREVVKLGVIESVKPIELDDSSGGGASVGGVFGQVGGASTGGGRGSNVGIILGGVIGGTLGHQAGIATKPGLEIWVRLDGEEGKSAYVMQPGQPDDFKIGDRVRVVSKKGETRVELDSGGTAK
ncbi:MAG: hypothetical protein HYS19_04975 [Nitrosomonadales bacterium]|nr:hypothetical protein [Nitrosomonadales bacterium]